MRELALFAGAGGGLLASRLLRWDTVCAVEINDYCRRVLLQRQREGHLERFPIWDDVCTFDGREWAGRIDVVSGGFPCQPFSSAARGRHVAADLWPEMLRIIGEVRPRYVFAENVKREPIARACEDLADRGYSTRFARVSAAWVGAPHRRSRWWAVGDADPGSEPVGAVYAEAPGMPRAGPSIWPAPDFIRIRASNGVAGRVDRMRAAGNGQVPAVAARAWSLLTAV
jgi:DNA (cytosine-5)-methyltransferase 1